MRTLLCAIPALLALAGTALAEPQQLDEAQLGGIAAGQGQEAAGFNLSTNQSNITSTATSTTNTFERTVNQSLGGMSTNNTYATGLMNSSNVTATGSAITNLGGSIAP